MSTNLRVALLLSCTWIAGCAHRPCKALGTLFGCECVSKREQPEYQDMRIKLPLFNYDLELDTDLDGHTLQAIRIAADDFLDAEPTGLPCESRQASHRYRALRKGEVIFVRIDYKPESCGQAVRMLDAGATYAISVEGQILRRELDGLGAWGDRPAPRSGPVPEPSPDTPAPAPEAPAPEETAPHPLPAPPPSDEVPQEPVHAAGSSVEQQSPLGGDTAASPQQPQAPLSPPPAAAKGSSK